MIIDFHAHPVPKAFRKWLPLLNIDVIEDDGFPLPQWSKEAHLQFMDEAGINYTVLSLPTPHIHHGNDEKSMQAASEINDELALLNSDRFGWTACLPLPYVEGSVAKIRRCMEKGALGVKVPTNANGIYPGDPMLDPVMEELNRQNALVIMEEGIFRGLFYHIVCIDHSMKYAMLLQAFLFGVWHIVTPLHNLADGDINFGSFMVLGIGYIILAGMMGIKWELLYRITGSLYAGMADHFFNNCIATNLLHVVTESGTDEMMLVRVLIAQLLSFILVLLVWKRQEKRQEGPDWEK